MEYCVIAQELKTTSNSAIDDTILLRDRIAESFRRIGLFTSIPYTNSINIIDIPFLIKKRANKNQYSILIKKNDMPNDFDVFDMYAREKLLQFEMCIPINISDDENYITINLLSSHLFQGY